MRNTKSMRKQTCIWTLVFTVVIGFQSCKKNTDTDPLPVVFSFTAPDTLEFEHSGAMPLEVSVQCTQEKQFGASLSGLNAAFSDGYQQLLISSNQSASFNIQFYQTNALPGTYPCQLTVSVANENNTPQSKTIQLKYTPNCAYNYRNYQNGEITYQSNGTLLNKSINCTYNDQGQLAVSGLTTYTVVLNFDCPSQTVTMQPLTNLGFYMTADGSIQGQDIVLTMYSDGNLHAVARIKP